MWSTVLARYAALAGAACALIHCAQPVTELSSEALGDKRVFHVPAGVLDIVPDESIESSFVNCPESLHGRHFTSQKAIKFYHAPMPRRQAKTFSVSQFNRTGGPLHFGMRVSGNASCEVVLKNRGIEVGLHGAAAVAKAHRNEAQVRGLSLKPGEWITNFTPIPHDQFYSAFVTAEERRGECHIEFIAHRQPLNSLQRNTPIDTYQGCTFPKSAFPKRRAEVQANPELLVYSGELLASQVKLRLDLAFEGESLCGAQRGSAALLRHRSCKLHIGPHMDDAACKRDMVAMRLPNGVVLDSLDPQTATRDASFPNDGNWGIDYLLNVNAVNRCEASRRICVAVQVSENKEATFAYAKLHAGIEPKPMTEDKRIVTRDPKREASLVLGCCDVDAQSKASCNASWHLGGPSNGAMPIEYAVYDTATHQASR